MRWEVIPDEFLNLRAGYYVNFVLTPESDILIMGHVDSIDFEALTATIKPLGAGSSVTVPYQQLRGLIHGGTGVTGSIGIGWGGQMPSGGVMMDHAGLAPVYYRNFRVGQITGINMIVSDVKWGWWHTVKAWFIKFAVKVLFLDKI